eukprot:TRINITY_DN11163_c0_g1_i3.p1 TRINITY_DN11163_c0_g1~~TRINITY_DN11163_c0_g1_i3.p1  ORF type:complete len:1268 (+),score=189.18 TRINITY_DN11163_c0_g1_i3:234-3806(+)
MEAAISAGDSGSSPLERQGSAGLEGATCAPRLRGPRPLRSAPPSLDLEHEEDIPPMDVDGEDLGLIASTQTWPVTVTACTAQRRPRPPPLSQPADQTIAAADAAAASAVISAKEAARAASQPCGFASWTVPRPAVKLSGVPEADEEDYGGDEQHTSSRASSRTSSGGGGLDSFVANGDASARAGPRRRQDMGSRGSPEQDHSDSMSLPEDHSDSMNLPEDATLPGRPRATPSAPLMLLHSSGRSREKGSNRNAIGGGSDAQRPVGQGRSERHDLQFEVQQREKRDLHEAKRSLMRSQWQEEPGGTIGKEMEGTGKDGLCKHEVEMVSDDPRRIVSPKLLEKAEDVGQEKQVSVSTLLTQGHTQCSHEASPERAWRQHGDVEEEREETELKQLRQRARFEEAMTRNSHGEIDAEKTLINGGGAGRDLKVSTQGRRADRGEVQQEDGDEAGRDQSSHLHVRRRHEDSRAGFNSGSSSDGTGEAGISSLRRRRQAAVEKNGIYRDQVANSSAVGSPTSGRYARRTGRKSDWDSRRAELAEAFRRRRETEQRYVQTDRREHIDPQQAAPKKEKNDEDKDCYSLQNGGKTEKCTREAEPRREAAWCVRNEEDEGSRQSGWDLHEAEPRWEAGRRVQAAEARREVSRCDQATEPRWEESPREMDRRLKKDDEHTYRNPQYAKESESQRDAGSRVRNEENEHLWRSGQRLQDTQPRREARRRHQRTEAPRECGQKSGPQWEGRLEADRHAPMREDWQSRNTQRLEEVEPRREAGRCAQVDDYECSLRSGQRAEQAESWQEADLRAASPRKVSPRGRETELWQKECRKAQDALPRLRADRGADHDTSKYTYGTGQRAQEVDLQRATVWRTDEAEAGPLRDKKQSEGCRRSGTAEVGQQASMHIHEGDPQTRKHTAFSSRHVSEGENEEKGRSRPGGRQVMWCHQGGEPCQEASFGAPVVESELLTGRNAQADDILLEASRRTDEIGPRGRWTAVASTREVPCRRKEDGVREKEENSDFLGAEQSEQERTVLQSRQVSEANSEVVDRTHQQDDSRRQHQGTRQVTEDAKRDESIVNKRVGAMPVAADGRRYSPKSETVRSGSVLTNQDLLSDCIEAGVGRHQALEAAALGRLQAHAKAEPPICNGVVDEERQRCETDEEEAARWQPAPLLKLGPSSYQGPSTEHQAPPVHDGGVAECKI